MIDVTCSVGEDEVVNVCIGEGGVFILDEAVEEKNRSKQNCGCKDRCRCEERKGHSRVIPELFIFAWKTNEETPLPS